MRRYLIINCIKSLKDMFVAQAAHIVEYDDMTVENRWEAYTTGCGHFYRNKGQQHLMRCFGNIEDYQLVLEHTDKSYGVVSGEFDNVVSAATTHWPVVAPAIHISGSDDGDVLSSVDDDEADSDSNYDGAGSDSNDEETEADSNDEEAEADSNDEEADSDDTDAAKDDEDKYDSDK